MTTIPEWISALANIGIAGGAIGIFFQWRYERERHRREAAIIFQDSFIETPGARNAALMLSDDGREIPLWDHSNPESRYVPVSWLQVEHAFTRNSLGALPVGKYDTAIRDSFNDFFGRLTRLESLLEAELIGKADAEHILHHWVGIFGGERGSLPHMLKIKDYVTDCRLSRVKSLFGKYGVSW